MKPILLFGAALALLVVLFIGLPVLIMAQPPGLPSMPSQAPLDGGLSLLAIAGGAYAYKKYRKLETPSKD